MRHTKEMPDHHGRVDLRQPIPPQRRRWGLLVAMLVAVNIGSVAAAATIAYAVGRDSGPVRSDLAVHSGCQPRSECC